MESRLSYSDLVIITSLFFSALVGFDETLNVWALYVFIPVSFVTTFLQQGGFKLKRPMVILTALYAWVIFTYFFANNDALAAKELKQILGCFLLSFVVVQNAHKKKMLPWLFTVYILLFISAVYYGATNIIGTAYNIASDRVDDSSLNANTLSYYLLMLITSVFFLAVFSNTQFWEGFFKGLFWFLFPLTFGIAIFSASRQVLITAMPLLLLYAYVRYFKGKHKHPLGVVIMVILAGLILAPSVESIYDRSYLKQRAALDIDEDSRVLLLQDAFNVGMEHPITGVGPGNYIIYSYNRHFSHCTYTELFANTGLPGMLIFVFMLYEFIRKQIQRYRQYKDTIFLAFCFWGIVFAYAQIFFVYYQSLWLISFFVFTFSVSDYYYSSKNKQVQNI